LRELRVAARRLVQRTFHDADVRDLTAKMEVEQVQAVLHATRLQLFEAADDLADGQTEFRPEPARRLPPAAAACRQLHPHPDLGTNPDLLGVLENEPQFRVFLDDGDDVAPDLEGQHRRFDEFRVFEAVADDGRVVVRDGDNRQQFRLGARFKAEFVRAAEVEDLLDHLALLIHLDRIHAAVATLVLMLGDGALKCRVNVRETMFEDVGEPDEHGETDAAHLQTIDELLQVDGARLVLRRMDLNVPLTVDW